jgi:hypothetical protein
MNANMNKLVNTISGALITLLLSVVPVSAQEAVGETDALSRTVGLEIEAEIAAVDQQTREITFKSGMFQFSVYVPERVINLADINVGDIIVGTYSASVEVELGSPTEADLAEPWNVLEEGALTGEGDDLGVEKARLVRAVVTVAGVDTARGIVVVTDSRGAVHFISEVEPEKLTGLAVAQQIVVVFTNSMAVTLEKKS